MTKSITKSEISDTNVIYVQWDSYYGGIERITKSYEEIFSDHNPTVAVLRPTKPGIKYKNEYVFNQKSRIFFLFSYFNFIRRRKYSVIHIQYTNSIILLFAYLAGAKKIIYHFHGTKFSHSFIDRVIWKTLEKKIILVANSRHTQNIMRERLKLTAAIDVIPNFIKVKDFVYQERSFKAGDEFLITYAGRFDKGKNITLILEIAAKLMNNTDQITFNLVGGGPDKENIEKLIREYHLESIVKLLPYTDDILKVYYKSKLFIFTSLHESFGNVIAEAILTGLPVLTNKLPAITEFIHDDLFFFEKQDAELISEKVKYIQNNYTEVTSRIVKVNEQLRNYLDNDKIIASLKSLYKN